MYLSVDVYKIIILTFIFGFSIKDLKLKKDGFGFAIFFGLQKNSFWTLTADKNNMSTDENSRPLDLTDNTEPISNIIIIVNNLLLISLFLFSIPILMYLFTLLLPRSDC